jgi:hypothetical protein
MAGTAFLSWDKWFGRLIHAIAVAISRWLHQLRRERSLAMSAAWPQAEGTVHAINWDSSFPREEIVYFYSTDCGYHSGFFWRWFDATDAREVRVGDPITLRFDPKEHNKSVFLGFR